MHHSKSIGSFKSNHEPDVPIGARPRARSSLDTFLIPGRTRIPSTKPETIDTQIAQTLLSSKMTRAPKKDIEGQEISHVGNHGNQTRTRDANPNLDPHGRGTGEAVKRHHPHQNDRAPRSKRKKQPYHLAGRPIVIVGDPGQSQHQNSNEPQKSRSPRHQQNPSPSPYDGTPASSNESRVTSLSWTTVSHRLVSDSSGSSGLRELDALAQYNRLARENGLSELKGCPGDEHFKEKITDKVRHHGWLARKIFRRSSSTYNLEIKSTQKPIKKRMSLAKLPKLADGERRNIIKDKTLEEMGRLGGLATFTLPTAFAVDKIALPTCLSTVASYLLQNGTNAPGLFRISGQSGVVNELYDYYAHQFSQAGSPTKVRETVGRGELPQHIEYTIHDVASFFKKVVISLPGGLLGSLELFEAFRDIFFRLSPKTELSDLDMDVLRARLITLAISTVSSQYQIQLILAVLGIASFFGCEAEKAKAELKQKDVGPSGKAPSSELMGYQSLGVVLGPLLLGKMMDEIEIKSPTPEPALQTSGDSDKKASKKNKRESQPSKLEKNAMLTASIERANLTANIMELLLMCWQDVVTQSRDPSGSGSGSSQSNQNKSRTNFSNTPGSRLTLQNPEEATMFMDLLRGRTLPEELVDGEVETKTSVRISSRSPVSKKMHPVLEDSVTNLASDGIPSEKVDVDEKVPKEDDVVPVLRANHATKSRSPSTAKSIERPRSSTSGLPNHEESRSNLSPDHMSMGTILPRIRDNPITPVSRGQPRNLQTSRSSKFDRSDHSHQDLSNTTIRNVSTKQRDRSFNTSLPLEKPLPPIGDAPLAELSPSVPENEQDLASSDIFPARKSSLATNKSSPPRFPPRPAPRSRAGKLGLADERFMRMSHSNTSEGAEKTENSRSGPESSDSISGSLEDSTKALTQRFTEACRANRLAQEMEGGPFSVYAQIHDLKSSEKVYQDDPFSSSPKVGSARGTLIPKPVQSSGSPRKTQSPNSSPSLMALGQFNRDTPSPRMLNDGAGEHNSIEAKLGFTNSPQTVVKSTTNPHAESRERTLSTPSHSRTDSGTVLDVAPTRPLSAYSSESIRRTQLEEDPPVAQHVTPAPSRILSFDIDARDESVKTIYHEMGARNFEGNGLKRTGSNNTTLLTEIARLKRLLDQKTQEVESARRSLDAIRDAREALNPTVSRVSEQGNGEAFPGGGSMKGTLSEEVRLARKERNEWRRRAEWAEGRLAAMDEGRKINNKPSDR